MFGLTDIQAPPAWLSAGEAGDWLGVSSRRIRALLADGSLDGRMSAHGAWEVSRLSVVHRLERHARPVRPLAPHGVRLLADAIASALDEVPSAAWTRAAARDRSRAVERLERLHDDPDPIALARAWIRNRRIEQGRHQMRATEITSLLAVPGVRLSGVSHPLSHLDPVGEIEVQASGPIACAGLEQAACAADTEDAVNVWVHHGEEWCAGDVVFDLIEHEGARESADAGRLLALAAQPRVVTS